MQLSILLLLLLSHFLADFILQPRWMALKKSEDWKVLAYHAGIHYGMFFAILLYPLGFTNAVGLAAMNAIAHAAIDWNIWKGYKAWAKKQPQPFNPFADENAHWFFVVVGTDQFLHGASFVAAYWLVIR